MNEKSAGGRKPRQDGAAVRRTEGGNARRFRSALWVALAVVLAGGAAAVIGRQAAAPPEDAASGAAASIGGPFRLVDQGGRAVDQSILRGRWSAVFFGYTSCPDVCPATLQALGAAQDRLGPDGAKLQPVLITVDPERDHPAELKVYLEQPGFPKGAVGLTGTPQQVAQVAREYVAFYRKRPRPDGSYDMDHSAFIYLMNPQGRFVRTLSEQQGPDAIAQAVREEMRKG